MNTKKTVLLMDEAYLLADEDRQGFQRWASYQEFVLTNSGAWNIYQRFDDRFDVRIGGNTLMVTQSLGQLTGHEPPNSLPRTLDELAAHPKSPNEPVVVDWQGDKPKILAVGDFEAPEFSDVLRFLKNKVREYEQMQCAQSI